MRFPQTFIDDLRRQADIVRVVQDYVPSLKKKGANWQACCPFHQEKTPSFSVNPAKEIFYCFGCAEGGSVFNFVMKIENVAFPEAVKIVAAKANVPLPQMEHDQRFEQRRQEADVVMQLNGWALEFWERQLQADTPDARAAREYLHGRGIADETRAKFRLGYAPERWDALLNYLKQKGATLEQLTKSGLVVVKEDGKMYDRFRGRVMFPVLDAQGRAVAFGGRVMGSGEPKYLNSPETAAYVKGRHLYGLFQNREEIKRRKFTILVEGYLDLIIPYQFGVRNMVASLGTALTPEQAKLLARFARRAVVNYDGDSAGVKAARRAIEVLLTEDFELKVLVLPDGADPDEFVRKHGAEEYNQRRGEAAPHIQFVIAQAVRERNLQHPSDKAAAVEDVFPFLRAVRNPIQRREYFDRAMNELLVEADLRRQLWETIRQTNPNAGKSNVDVSETVLRASRTPPTLAERKLLALLLTDAELRVAFTPLLTPADYAELPTAAIFGALLEAAPDETDWPARLAHDPWAQEILPEILAPAIGQAQRAAGEALDEFLHEAQKCLVQLRLMLSERRLQEIRARVSVAQRAGDQAEADRLLLEQFQWDKYKRNLLSQVAG
jgi:DNA primase